MRKACVFILVIFGSLLSLSTSAQKYKIISGGPGWKAIAGFPSTDWMDVNFDDSGWGVPTSPSPNTVSTPIPTTQTMWLTPYSQEVYFRYSFELKSNCVKSGFPAGGNPTASLITVDDYMEIFVNGNLAGSGLRNNYPIIITPFLKIGKNVIAIRATNNSGPYALSYGVDIDYTSRPEISMSPDQTACTGDSASFAPIPIYESYLWSNGDTSRTTTVKTAGKYWVTAKDTAGCNWVDTVELVTFNHVDVDLGSDKTLCDGQQATFDAGAGYTKYDWSNGDVTQTITVGYQGEFRVEVTDANGCTSRDTVTTERFNNASVDIGNDTSLCVGDRIVLDATFPFSSYKWEDGSTNPLRSVSDPGNYAVTVTNACGNVTDNVNVSNITDIVVDLGEDDVLCGYQYYELVADVKGATSYEWSTGETTSRIAVEESGEYWVKVIDKCGNEGYDEKELLGGLDRGFVGANSFTPNGDLLNDTWRADIYSYGDYSLTIVNKWNNTMFETNDPLEAWDGRHEGELVPAGTYSYIITYVNCDSQKLIITGYVNVIR